MLVGRGFEMQLIMSADKSRVRFVQLPHSLAMNSTVGDEERCCRNIVVVPEDFVVLRFHIRHYLIGQDSVK